MNRIKAGAVTGLVCLLLILAVISLGIGRYPVQLNVVIQVLAGHVAGNGANHAPASSDVVVWLVRVPRIIAACCIGMALSLAGVCYQTVFRNPLASPSLLGVSAGAAAGASFALLLHASWIVLQLSAFSGGLVAVLTSLFVSRILGQGSIVTLILCGLVISAAGEAIVSLLKYFADPLDTLPAITFWLMGGLDRITGSDLKLAVPFLIVSATVLYIFRWRMTTLVLGDDVATALGISVRNIRTSVIILATLMVAVSVSLAGIIGWVGLIVPHAARMLFGLAPEKNLPTTGLMGAIFVLLVDDFARSAGALELPLGILTALIGAPVFLILLSRSRATGWA